MLTNGSIYIKIIKAESEFIEYRIDIKNAEEAKKIGLKGITEYDRYNEITPLIKKYMNVFLD